MSRVSLPTGALPTLLCLTVLTTALPGRVAGQTENRFFLGLSAARTQLHIFERLGDAGGFLYGVEGGGSFWRMRVRGEYRLGSVAPDPSGDHVDVSSARALLGVELLPWMAIEGGPRYTAVRLTEGTRRVLRWRIGLAGDVPMIPRRMSGFYAAGGSFAGTDIGGVGVPGGGGEIGLEVMPNGSSWIRLGYRLDREYLSAGPSQTFQTAFLTLGISMTR